jgi:hypothetical protein
MSLITAKCAHAHCQQTIFLSLNGWVHLDTDTYACPREDADGNETWAQRVL